MPSLTEQVAQETWELMFRMLGISTGVVADTIAAGGEVTNLSKRALEELIDKIRKQNAANKEDELLEDGTMALVNLVKKIDKDNAQLMSLPIADEDVAIMKEQFKKQDITFAVWDVGFDDMQMFWFANTDQRKAELAVMQAQAERGLISDINPDIFFNNMLSDNVGTLSGLSNVELELFRFHAKRNGLLFTSVAENGLNTVVYNLETADKAKKTAADVLWDQVGSEGELIRKQIEYKITNRQAVNRAFLDGEREYYIVNASHPANYIHITARDFEYYKQSKKVYDVSRSTPSFMDRAIQAVNGFDNPVLLSKEEFALSNPEQLATLIKKAEQTAINNEVLQKAIDKQMAKRVLIEEKMQLDDENQGAFWLFDSSISYSEGSTNETIDNFDDEQRKVVQQLQSSAQRFSFNEIKVDERNLDTLIAKAEAQRDRGYRYAEEPERVM